jgi:hypothetical protein
MRLAIRHQLVQRIEVDVLQALALVQGSVLVSTREQIAAIELNRFFEDFYLHRLTHLTGNSQNAARSWIGPREVVVDIYV